MNPAHRDRIAFLRIVSGKFERGMSVKHVRAGKDIKLSQPQQFLAQDRDIVEEAYPGDIIGLFDPGIFRIGDTLSQAGDMEFDELPTFSPEIFSKVSIKNALKSKQFQKGIDQLTEEGMIQVFRTVNFDDILLGVVGQLQFEVFEYRMKGNTAWMFSCSGCHISSHAGSWMRINRTRANSASTLRWLPIRRATTWCCSRTNMRCVQRWRRTRPRSSWKQLLECRLLTNSGCRCSCR